MYRLPFAGFADSPELTKHILPHQIGSLDFLLTPSSACDGPQTRQPQTSKHNQSEILHKS